MIHFRFFFFKSFIAFTSVFLQEIIHSLQPDISFMKAQLDKPSQCFILLNLQNVTHCQSRRVIYVCNEMLTFEHR